MTRADQIVERGADLLQDLSQRVHAQGGLASRLAPELAGDAAFLRKLKPTLVVARIKGRAPTNGHVAHEVVRQAASPPAPKPRRSGGPSPVLVAGAALLIGMVTAKLVDWRGHAHPRR